MNNLASYTPKYTSETLIERELQFDITSATSPDSDELLTIIQEVEEEIDAKKLGWKDGGDYGDGYEISGLYIDVPDSVEELTPLEREKGKKVERVYLEDYPILSMIYLKRRTNSDMEETPEWEDLTEGYYEGWAEGQSDYRVIKIRGPDGQKYGIGWEFYNPDKMPKAGPCRLKAAFTYSYNVPKYILQEYATLKCAIRVAELVVMSGEPVRIAGWTGGDFQEFVNTELTNIINRWKERVKEIEEKHFPRKIKPAI